MKESSPSVIRINYDFSFNYLNWILMFGSTFGSSFGASSGGSGLFGSGITTSANPKKGTTHAKYVPTQISDGYQRERIASLAAMKVFKDKSEAELRFEDYEQKKSSSAPSLFGSTTSGGLFGSAGTTATTASSIFSAKPATTSGLLGTTTPAIQGLGTGGLFGSSISQTAGTGLFGSSTTQAAGTGLFGSSTTQAAGSGGLFGSSTSQTAGTGLFGSSTSQTAGTGLFGSSTSKTAGTGGLFGSSTTPSAGGLFGSTPATNSIFQTSTSSLSKPTGLLGLTSAKTPQTGTCLLEEANSRQKALANQLRTQTSFEVYGCPSAFVQALNVHLVSDESSVEPKNEIETISENKPNNVTGKQKAEESLLFHFKREFNPAIGSQNLNPKVPWDEPLTPKSPKEENHCILNYDIDSSLLPMILPELRNAFTKQLEMKRPKVSGVNGGPSFPKSESYKLSPSPLAANPRSDRFLVENFTVSLDGYGSVTWPGNTDVTNLNIDRIVRIRPRFVSVYEIGEKPPRGEGLNKPALLTFSNVLAGVLERSEAQESELEQRILGILRANNAEFVDFDSANGILRCKVAGF